MDWWIGSLALSFVACLSWVPWMSQSAGDKALDKSEQLETICHLHQEIYQLDGYDSSLYEFLETFENAPEDLIEKAYFSAISDPKLTGPIRECDELRATLGLNEPAIIMDKIREAQNLAKTWTLAGWLSSIFRKDPAMEKEAVLPMACTTDMAKSAQLRLLLLTRASDVLNNMEAYYTLQFMSVFRVWGKKRDPSVQQSGRREKLMAKCSEIIPKEDWAKQDL